MPAHVFKWFHPCWDSGFILSGGERKKNQVVGALSSCSNALSKVEQCC